MRLRSFAILSFAWLAAAAPAHAAIFLRYNGIQGDITDPQFQSDILLDSFSLGDSRSVGPPAGGNDQGSVSGLGAVSVSSIATQASVALFTESLVGEPADASIYITEILNNTTVIPTEWDFFNTLISSFSTSSGGDTPEDFYTLNFTRVTYTSTTFDTLGNFRGRTSVTYDASTGIATTSSNLLGDANLDGTVDLIDLNIVLNHLGTADLRYADGNFDSQPTIDLTDLNDVLNNLGTSAPSIALAAPEPASLSLFALGGLLLTRRRHSR
jgi:type VI secretion system secreted protein Hcp